MEERVEITTITPTMAASLLDANTHNRNMSDARVRQLASIISRGEWMMNGDAIRVGSDGVLLDGQHRLAAIMLSGKSIKSILVTGLEPKTFETIDRGTKRSVADDMHLAGYANAATVSACAVMLMKYRLHGSPFYGFDYPTATQLLKCAKDNPAITEHVSWVHGRGQWCKKNIAPTTSAFCRMVFTEKYKGEGVHFFDLLESGASLEQGSPVLALRERLTAESSSRARIQKAYKCALIFKSFRLFVDGATIKQLRVKIDGSIADPANFAL